MCLCGKPMKIKTIFFDIGGVLLDIHPDRTVAHIAQVMEMPTEDVLNLFPMDAHHRYEKGEVNDEEFYLEVCKSLPKGKHLPEDAFWSAWQKLVGKETGVSEILDELKKKYPVWLLSNTNSRHIVNGVGNSFPFFQHVDGAIYSYEVGSRKPEADIFETALKLANTTAEQSLFIDDNQENIEQAKKMGFQTILFTSVSEMINEEIIQEILNA